MQKTPFLLPFCCFVLSSYVFFFYFEVIWTSPGPAKALLAPPVQYWDSLEQIKFVCVSVCLFLSLFPFVHISVHGLLKCFCDSGNFPPGRPWYASLFICCHNAADLYKCRKWQQIITFTLRGQKMYISVDLIAEGVKCILTMYRRIDFQMLWILSDMKPSQPPEKWKKPLER